MRPPRLDKGVRLRFMMDTVAPAAGRQTSGRGSGSWATLDASAPGSTSSSMAASPSRRAVVFVEVSVVEHRYQAVLEVPLGAAARAPFGCLTGRQRSSRSGEGLL